MFQWIQNRLTLTSFSFPEFSLWSNYMRCILKGLESSDPTKHVLQFCTICSQDSRCRRVTTDRSTTADISAHSNIRKYQVLTSSALSGILKVHRARDQLDVNGHRGLSLRVCAHGFWKWLPLGKDSLLWKLWKVSLRKRSTQNGSNPPFCQFCQMWSISAKSLPTH